MFSQRTTAPDKKNVILQHCVSASSKTNFVEQQSNWQGKPLSFPQPFLFLLCTSADLSPLFPPSLFLPHIHSLSVQNRGKLEQGLSDVIRSLVSNNNKNIFNPGIIPVGQPASRSCAPRKQGTEPSINRAGDNIIRLESRDLVCRYIRIDL
jgi:hypothetical protein